MRNFLSVILFLAVAGYLAFTQAEDATGKGAVISSDKVQTRVNEQGTGEVQMLISKEQTGNSSVYMGKILFHAGGSVPEHFHADSAEMVYVIKGKGDFVMAGKAMQVKAGDALYIPAGTKHSFSNAGPETVEALQFYSPAGPEERFKDWKLKP